MIDIELYSESKEPARITHTSKPKFKLDVLIHELQIARAKEPSIVRKPTWELSNYGG